MNDGGPAFPQTHESRDGSYINYAGMTLRDYFAAKALPWILSDLPSGDDFHARCAEMAYYMADTMLAERAKHE